jgi:hypothetical protein
MKMGSLSSTFEKADSAYNISAPPVHGQKKQLSLLKQRKLAFIGRNVLMAMKIQRDNETRRDTYSGLDLSIYVIKSPIQLVRQSL